MIIILCGAELGGEIAFFVKLHPKAHIYAIEPAKKNVEILRKNYGHSKTVTIIP